MHEHSLRNFSMSFLQMRAGSMHLRTPIRRISLLLCVCMLLAVTYTACSPWPGSQGAISQLSVQGLPQAHLTYVALGASDTYGIGAEDPPMQNWPADLASKLGSNVHLVNLGVPDIKTHAALTAELPVALDAHPDLITIWLAVNDLATSVPVASYSQDLEQLLSRLQSAFPRARIAIANVPDLTLIPYFRAMFLQKVVDPDAVITPPGGPDQGPVFTQAIPTSVSVSVQGTPTPVSRPIQGPLDQSKFASLMELAQQDLKDQISAYNNSIASIVAQHHLLLVDLYQQWSTLKNHPEYISKDGLHPSTAGYAQIAQLFYQTLQKSGS